MPSVIQPSYQRKWYKCATRGLLGATSASYLVSGLAAAPDWQPAWQLRILVVCAFAITFNALRRFRARMLKSPCTNCPLGVYPTCEWNVARLVTLNATAGSVPTRAVGT